MRVQGLDQKPIVVVDTYSPCIGWRSFARVSISWVWMDNPTGEHILYAKAFCREHNADSLRLDTKEAPIVPLDIILHQLHPQVFRRSALRTLSTHVMEPPM